MYKVYWTATSKEDLKNICNIFQSNSAKKLKNHLLDYISLLEIFPFIGRKVPELNEDNIRELIFRKYRIIYKIKNKNIFISQIVHSSKQFFNIKDIDNFFR